MRPSPKLRNSRRVWYVVIAAALALHAAIFLLIKPQYFRVFKTELPPGEENEESRFPYLDNPFRVIPLAPEPETRPVQREERTEDKKVEQQSDISLEEYEFGEPQIDVRPFQRGGGGGGKQGPRKATVEPKPLYIPWPKYPAGIRAVPSGSVELLLLINERGEVEDVKITRKLPLEQLNDIAVQAARKIRFSPGLTNGMRAPMWVRLSIGFQPR